MFKTVKKGLNAGLWAYYLTFLCAYAFTGKAHAQTYVRPSKGTVLEVIRIPQSTAITTSQLYDWTSFSAAVTTFRWTSASGGDCACPAGHKCIFSFVYKVQGATAKTGPFIEVDGVGAGVPVSGTAVNDAFTLAPVNVSLPYVRFLAQTDQFIDKTTGNPIATACYMSVSITPTPFTYRSISEGVAGNRTILPSTAAPVIIGGSNYTYDSNYNTTPSILRVNESGVLAVGGGAGNPMLPTTANYGAPSPFTVAASPNPSTIVWEFGGSTASARTGVRLENVGAQPVYCAAGTNSGSVSLTNYSFSLKKPVTAGDGSGGVMDIPQMDVKFASGVEAARVSCIAPVAGASAVAVMPY